MMETKFTPGPWKVGPVDDTLVATADGNEVAQICGDYNQSETWPVMEANARLIAAAPDLYAAVESLLKLIDDSSWCLRLQTERAALAKARGENPEP